ncbi:MAG: MBL fold metallo-hydrolase [Ruminiclostridium sp.]|nr:MBL fold metallo-hydrolase [Ruminiclostridium sp.]
MIARILIDNISNNPDLAAEWGLSVCIEHEGRTYLLDTGGSDAFARNADALGVDLSNVDFGILSHAHYDHADGMPCFFRRNPDAPFFLRAGSGENCYGCEDEMLKYIGIKPGILKDFSSRIRYAEGMTKLAPGVYLLGHSTPDLDCCGQQYQMFLKIADQYMYDDFRHEQSLIFDTEKGLVIFNSCCHGGADLIVQEAMDAFPGKKVYAIVGGFHLFETPGGQVREFARRLEQAGVEQVITGHCTGQDGFDILKEVLGDKVRQMESGLTLEF